MNKNVLTAYEFFSLNESKCSSKKDFGLIGPLPSGELKIMMKDVMEASENPETDSYILTVKDTNVELPKNACNIDSNQATIRTDMNWFRNDENFEKFHDLIEKYISCQQESDNNKLVDDVNLLTEEIGINPDVNDYECDCDTEISGRLTNGMEFELYKDSETDPMKKLYLYKNEDEIHPTIEIKRKGSSYQCKYRTPKGVFESQHDTLSSINKKPVDRYLVSVCCDKEDDFYQKELVDHLLKLFKYHSWQKPESGSEEKMERYLEESKEIKTVMEMLKNSIPEKHIEEMYSDARSKFISPNK